MRRVRGWLVCAIVPLAACSLVTSFDGFTGDVADAGPGAPDAGDVQDDATGDAPSTDAADTATMDAADDRDAPAIDAGIDAGPPVPFCPNAGSHTLCADFDEGNLTSAFSDTDGGPQWGLITSGSGTVGLAPVATAPSPPDVFAASIADIDGGTSNALLTFTQTGSVSSFVVAGYFLLDHPGPLDAGTAKLFTLLQTDPASIVYGGVGLRWNTGGLSLVNGVIEADGGTTTNVNCTVPPELLTGWVHFQLTVVYANPTGRITLTVGGTSLCDAKVSTLGELTPSSPELMFKLGLLSLASIPSATVQHDDVTIDVSP
jgi:hypothetical protein